MFRCVASLGTLRVVVWLLKLSVFTLVAPIAILPSIVCMRMGRGCICMCKLQCGTTRSSTLNCVLFVKLFPVLILFCFRTSSCFGVTDLAEALGRWGSWLRPPARAPHVVHFGGSHQQQQQQLGAMLYYLQVAHACGTTRASTQFQLCSFAELFSPC